MNKFYLEEEKERKIKKLQRLKDFSLLFSSPNEIEIKEEINKFIKNELKKYK